MDLPAAIALIKQSPDHRVLERLPIKESYHAEDGAEKKLALYLDTETTGLNPEKDKVIELAMILFEYSADGKIYRILEVFDQYQDPGMPIPAEITRITGITDEMVKGQKIDLDQVHTLLNQAALVIAHNAQFDRAFAEILTPVFQKKCWACSIEDIPWKKAGLESTKLEYLAYRFGFFYEGHRAKTDCYAGIHLLAQMMPNSADKETDAPEGSALAMLLQGARAPRYEVRAIRSPFETKDLLKTRGYRWKTLPDSQKCWVAMVLGDALEQEKAFLENEVYANQEAPYVVKKITPFDRFTSRS